MSIATAPTPIISGVILVSEEDQPVIPTPWRTVGAVSRWFDSMRAQTVGYRLSHTDCPLARCYRELDGEHHEWVVGLTYGSITVDDGTRLYPMEDWEVAFSAEIDALSITEDGTEPVTGYGAYYALKQALEHLEDQEADARYAAELRAEWELGAQA